MWPFKEINMLKVKIANLEDQLRFFGNVLADRNLQRHSLLLQVHDQQQEIDELKTKIPNRNPKTGLYIVHNR
jgi:hypothetical protein